MHSAPGSAIRKLLNPADVGSQYEALPSSLLRFCLKCTHAHRSSCLLGSIFADRSASNKSSFGVAPGPAPQRDDRYELSCVPRFSDYAIGSKRWKPPHYAFCLRSQLPKNAQSDQIY